MDKDPSQELPYVKSKMFNWIKSLFKKHQPVLSIGPMDPKTRIGKVFADGKETKLGIYIWDANDPIFKIK